MYNLMMMMMVMVGGGGGSLPEGRFIGFYATQGLNE